MLLVLKSDDLLFIIKRIVKIYSTWLPLQKLLKMKNGLFILLFSEHDVCHHLGRSTCEK